MAASNGYWSLVHRDLLLASRHRGDALNPVIFFVMTTTLVPLAISPDPSRLAVLAPGMIWITALLATLLALDGLFQDDFVDGSLLQIMLSPQPLWLLVLAKITAHWLVTGLPIIIASPVLAMTLSLPVAGYWPLVVGLTLGTACFSLLGAVGAALTVALRKGGILIVLVIMPFYFPVLIFGVTAVYRATVGLDYGSVLALLGALSAFALLVGPFAAAGALKVGVDG